MLPFALNHMTTPTLSVADVFGLARKLGCSGVEFRNDLNRPLFDGLTPEAVADMARDAGLRIYALAEVKAFNHTPNDKIDDLQTLLKTATACGAEAVALIPHVATRPVARNAQRDALRRALTLYRPMVEDAGVVGLIEPLGFAVSSLRHKDDVAVVLAEMGNPACFKIVHDTFHHHLSGDTRMHTDLTALVHISGITDPTETMTDAHRGLVDDADRLNTITQLHTLTAQGYTGPASFECFAPHVHDMADPAAALAGSIAFITSHMTAIAA